MYRAVNIGNQAFNYIHGIQLIHPIAFCWWSGNLGTYFAYLFVLQKLVHINTFKNVTLNPKGA